MAGRRRGGHAGSCGARLGCCRCRCRRGLQDARGSTRAVTRTPRTRRGTCRRLARSGSIDATARLATTNSFGTNDGVRKEVATGKVPAQCLLVWVLKVHADCCKAPLRHYTLLFRTVLRYCGAQDLRALRHWAFGDFACRHWALGIGHGRRCRTGSRLPGSTSKTTPSSCGGLP